MNTSKWLVLLISAVFSITSWSASSRSKAIAALDDIASQYGLVRTEKKGIDLVYRRPGASLSGYRKLLMKPIDVMFSKNFDPGRNSTLYKMNPPDRERIKTELAEVFAQEFKEELEKGSYQMVTESGPDVLEVRAAIVNLYITAPDISMQTAGRVKTYTTDAGEMTLVMELRDSTTETILAQVYDRRGGTAGGGFWTWSNSVTNTAEARRIIGSWATSLRKALDASRAG